MRTQSGCHIELRSEDGLAVQNTPLWLKWGAISLYNLNHHALPAPSRGKYYTSRGTLTLLVLLDNGHRHAIVGGGAPRFRKRNVLSGLDGIQGRCK